MAITTRIHAFARLKGLAALLAGGLLAATACVAQAQGERAPLPPMPSASTAGTGGGAGGAGARAAKPTLGCLISPERTADIGSPVLGVVSEIKVEAGSFVHAGQPLVVLQSSVEQAGLQAAQARSSIEADVNAAKANLQLAEQRHKRATELLAEGFVSDQAVEQARAEREVAAQKLQQARGQQQVSREEMRVVQAQLSQRTVRSPFNGVVVERFVNTGERVEDKPLLRLAMLDPLKVEVVMPATRWGSVALQDTIGVTPDLPGAGSLQGRVTYVDKVIDAASNTFRVRLALPNPGNKLPAGARCKVDLPGMSVISSPLNPTPIHPGLGTPASRRSL